VSENEALVIHIWLQWGRGNEAAEEMTGTMTGRCRIVLQWGRGDEAAEDLVLEARFPARFRLLQWGRGDEAAEDSEGTDRGPRQVAASMGPRR